MITFKTLEISDIDIITVMMEDFYAIDNYPIEAQATKKMFQEFISNENFGKAWLIYADNKIAGYVILTYIFSFEYGGKIAFVDELFIKESARGIGIGKETIQFVQQESPKLSLKLLYLEVENHNENAQKLYIAQDFVFHNRKLMKYKIAK
ncbi:GNAT family N-acetyltransferase [Flavobacterium psychraquaticum]|uniref:GNAT family N-acetyltransferase n=1 Tax=Flavobacterium psychraquaticum TaxID=3103958 RepID=UPI002ACE770E|nr:GNAT family N-acetyltransferase [Flavobacterium sp. LB-N7T]